jgi:hypothetical protein
MTYPYALYGRVLSLIQSLKDPITHYLAPYPYTTLATVRPWYLSTRRRADANTTIDFVFNTVASLNVTQYQQLFGVGDISSWNGWRVHEINGEAPEHFIASLSSQSGRFKDLSASINDILLDPENTFSRMFAHRVPLAEGGSVDRLTLSDPAHASSSSSSINVSLPLAAFFFPAPQVDVAMGSEIGFEVLSLSSLNCSSAENQTALQATNHSLQVGLLRMPPNSFDAAVLNDVAWALKISKAISAAAALESRALVIDLSVGPTSSLPVEWNEQALCLAEWFMQALVPSWRTTEYECDSLAGCAHGVYDFLESVATDLMVSTSTSVYGLQTSASDWVDVSGKPFDGLDGLDGWYSPGRSLVRGGNITRTFTSPSVWKGRCELIVNRLSQYWPTAELDKVLLISDGRVVGPNSFIINALRSQHRVMTLAYGGALNASMDYGASVGGVSPFTWPSTTPSANLRIEARSYLPSLPSAAGSLRIVFTEYYQLINQSLPREFLFLSSDFRSLIWPQTPIELDGVYCDSVSAVLSSKMPSGLLEWTGGPPFALSWKLTPLVLAVGIIACLLVLALFAAIGLALYRRLTFNYQELPTHVES